MVELVHEIDKALSNPVWEQVRRPAPWDEESWEERADAAIAAEAAALAADPVAAEAARRSAKICNCNAVSIGAIEDAISDGADSVAAVGKATAAGTGCGNCQERIAAIIEQTRIGAAAPQAA
jgi:nitrogenase molybdenum-cofactor synthesis protein NifE